MKKLRLNGENCHEQTTRKTAITTAASTGIGATLEYIRLKVIIIFFIKTHR